MSKTQWLRIMGNLLQLIATTQSDAARRVYRAQYASMKYRKTRKAALAGGDSE